jgi:streptogramin lyase
MTRFWRISLVSVALAVSGGAAADPVATATKATAPAPQPAAAPGRVSGSVHDGAGTPIAGAMVSFLRGDPLRVTTVFTDDAGAFAASGVAPAPGALVRVRRIGFRDLREPVDLASAPLDFTLAPETDPEAAAAQLPANRWLGLLLEKFDDEAQREEFVRQCTYCHQQGNAATRIPREDWQWEKVLTLMARLGGTLSPELRAKVPDLFRSAYDPKTAVPRLTAKLGTAEFAPAPSREVRRAIVDEWELGVRASMQHDLAVHPDGRVYSVDMLQDKLYRLDPASGAVRAFQIPDDGVPLGGVMAGEDAPPIPNATAHQGPHSLQMGPDGAVWITLALGNRIARFDPKTEKFELHALGEGFYPHTLRIDPRGRVWFTIAVSNHVGMYDPAARKMEIIRVPAGSLMQEVALRALPYVIAAADWLDVDLTSLASEGAAGSAPVPYGIDIAPDGGVWFSQLNQHRLGRIDPESFEIEMIDTPFTAPRRLRFDSQGRLWIPGFSSGLVASFDPKTRAFAEHRIPIEPLGSETPYALHVDRRSDTVWICGTNSDSLIRFEPRSQKFTVYPLPTRVTYTREIDFDAQGRVWTSNSNLPTWQIENGYPRVLRLDPATAPAATRVAEAVR